MEHTRVLSVQIGRRPAGSEGEAKAASYIEAAFIKGGYQVKRQEFRRADGGTSVNIVARLPDVDYSNGYLIIGGHFDTKEPSPGGNDNASGVGVILTLAKVLAHERRPVEFAAFAAEEIHPTSGKHHEGSLAHAAKLADPKAVKAMLSIDMVGAGSRVNIVSWSGRSTSLASEIATIAAKLRIRHRRIAKGDISDHTSYIRRGIPGAMLWSGDHSSLHTARDTFSVVQIDSVRRTGRLALEWIRRSAKAA